MRLPSALLCATALAAASLLAGCSGSSTASVDIPVHPLAGFPQANVSADGSFAVTLDADGCEEGILLVAIDPAHAASFLPAGFQPADLQALLETPVPTGKAAAWLNAYTCHGTHGNLTGAEFGIVVQPPAIVNGSVAEAELHIYQLAQMSDSPALAAALHHVGYPHLDADVQVSGGPTVGPASVTTFAVRHADASHTFQALATETEVMTTSANFYHQAEAGLAYTHFELTDIQVSQGTALTCAFTGLSAELAGATDCPPGSALTMVVPEQAWQASFRFLPGAHA